MSSVELVYSTNNEDFRCDDLMEVIGEIDEPKAGDTVYVGEKKHPDVGDFIDADNVIDDIANAGWDFGGEYAEDFPDVSAEAKEELDAYLKAWARKHCEARFYQVEKIRTYQLTQEDIDAYNGK